MKAGRDKWLAGRERRRVLFSAREPSAVERLAALADPAGPVAKNVALWAEREAWMSRMQGVLDVTVRYEAFSSR